MIIQFGYYGIYRWCIWGITIATDTERDVENIYKEFRHSKNVDMLLDEETGLWLNGPDYVADEYMRSKKKDVVRSILTDKIICMK